MRKSIKGGLNSFEVVFESFLSEIVYKFHSVFDMGSKMAHRLFFPKQSKQSAKDPPPQFLLFTHFSLYSYMQRHQPRRKCSIHGASELVASRIGGASLEGKPETEDDSSDEQPMQLGSARLLPKTCSKHLAAGLCLYCGTNGHFIAACLVQPKGHASQ